MDDRARVWMVRVLAPVAFLAAATLLVVLVQRALREEPTDAGTRTTGETVVVTTAPAETETDGGGEVGRRFYRIKVGDTLESIAVRFDTTVEELQQLNPGVDPLALTPGQRIRVS
jgi:LysM repeat protein